MHTKLIPRNRFLHEARTLAYFRYPASNKPLNIREFETYADPYNG